MRDRNSIVKDSRDGMVQDEANIHEAEKPHLCGQTGAVHDCVSHHLDLLVLMLSGILVLLVGLALPVADAKGMQNVLNLVANLNLCTVTDQLVHDSLFTDVIFESVDKLLVCLHPIDISYQGLCTNKELGGSSTRVNSGSIRENRISSDWFVMMMNINPY